MKSPIILGIESSCDDTSAAVIQSGKVLSNVTANQEVHQQYGGVVPELASRAHQKNIVPVVAQAIRVAKIEENQLSAIAYTRGPGLMGSLLVGGSFAKSLSMALDIPLLEINHMQAHIFAHFIEDEKQKKPDFPFLCLTVSGGHTQIIQINSFTDLQLLGETRDDAAGEAFDKIGKVLGLNYPAGPEIDRLARQGNSNAFVFPKSKLPDYEYSFSGLKTAVINFIHKEKQKNPNFISEHLNDLCASVQYSIISACLAKLDLAAKNRNINRLAIAGGVSANSELRKRLLNLGTENGYEVFIPKFEYTTDNAAMIAMVGQLKFEAGDFGTLTQKSVARYKI